MQQQLQKEDLGWIRGHLIFAKVLIAISSVAIVIASDLRGIHIRLMANGDYRIYLPDFAKWQVAVILGALMFIVIGICYGSRLRGNIDVLE